MFAFQTSLIVVLFLFYVIGKLYARANTVFKKIYEYLFWNGTIRYYMEAYLDLCLFAMLNISEIQWPENQPTVTTSNYIAYIVLTLCCVGPIVLCLIVWCYRKNLNEPTFTNKYSSFLEGTKSENPKFTKSAVLIAMVFFLRRFFLSLTLVFWPEFLWG